MQNPVILISTGIVSGERSPQRCISALYGDALTRAGHIGVLYTGGNPIALAKHCAGLLLAGGGDLAPERYGQTPNCSRLSIDPRRDAEEQALFTAFCDAHKPILGICRGVQALNVFLGGTLFQDIAGHSDTTHTVHTKEHSRIRSLTDPSFQANSFHHQSIDRLGDGCSATAFSEDETIEAIEHISLPILGVQWHPERMIPGLCADTNADHTSIFSFFSSPYLQ